MARHKYTFAVAFSGSVYKGVLQRLLLMVKVKFLFFFLPCLFVAGCNTAQMTVYEQEWGFRLNMLRDGRVRVGMAYKDFTAPGCWGLPDKLDESTTKNHLYTSITYERYDPHGLPYDLPIAYYFFDFTDNRLTRWHVSR